MIAFAAFAGAHAKNAAELQSEFDVEYKKGWTETLAFFEGNAADIKAAWEEYKKTPAAGKAEYDAERRMFSIAYCANLELSGSDWILCCLHAETFVKNRLADDPSFYSELKAGGWKIGANKMTQSQISGAAYAAKDFEYFSEAPIEAFADFYWANGEAFRFFAQNLLGMSDAEKAKSVCDKIETALILSGKDASALRQIQGMSKALTARILSAKILK